MKYVFALLAAAVLATPAVAQPHQQSHPGGSHPATHAPATHTTRPMSPHVAVRHMPARHVRTRHTVRRRVTSHHLVRHVAVHHGIRTVARPGRRAPRAVVAKLRKNVVAVHRFHVGPYRAPPGWRYRRWVFGERLPGIFFAPAFWITDFLAFDLFAPPDGYVWVRYGPDALLIDQYTGEIIQVQYGVFY